MAKPTERGEPLRQSEERFRLLVESVKDYAIFMLDPEGRVLTWNAGAELIKGYRAEEIIGEHFSKFYPDDDRAQGEPEQALATARTAGKFEGEGWRLRSDGSKFWAGVLIEPVRDDNGDLIGYAQVVRDVTERREAQRALDDAR